MSWLDDFLLAIRRVRNSAGEDQPYRAALQFGPGFTVTDHPATNALIIGGGGGGGATGATGPTGPTGATGATGASGVAGQLPSGWAELAGTVGFSPGPTLILSAQVTTETTANVWAAVSISWQTALASSGAAFFVTLSNGINTYTSDETWSDATSALDDVAASLNFRTPVPVAAGTWTARVYGRRTKSTASLVCTHCDLTVLGMQGARGPTGATGSTGATGATGPAGDITAGDVSLTGSIATVVGLQGRPVWDAAPSVGQVLTWTADSQWEPQPASTITSGDVSVTAGVATVTGLQGQPVGSASPPVGAFLAWNADVPEWTPYDVFGSGSDLTYVPGTSLTVSALQGRAVSTDVPTGGQMLVWRNGTQEWGPESLGLDLANVPDAAIVVGLQTVPVSSTAPTARQALVYSGAEWAPASIPAQVTFSAQINLKVAGVTQIGTLRSDLGRFFATEVWMHVDSVASLGVTGPSISVGWDGGTYAEWVSNTALPNSGLVDGYFSQVSLRAAGTSRISAPAGSGVFVQVNTASNATTYLATIIVRGFYLTNP